MATYSTRIHTTADAQPTVTNLYARCKVCGTQWQVWGDPPTNTSGCAFCDADDSAIQIISEAPDSDGQVMG